MNRTKENRYMSGLCVSLSVLLFGVFLYSAKKGGIPGKLQSFLFLSPQLKHYGQSFLITLNELGFLVAVARTLFPFLLLLLAIHYSLLPWIQRNQRWVKKVLWICPTISFIGYIPKIAHRFFLSSPVLQGSMSAFFNMWMFLYLGIAVGLLIYETHSIQIYFIKRSFRFVTAFLISLTVLYFLYSSQDPYTIYNLYNWKNNIYYARVLLSVPMYIVIVFLNVFLMIVSIGALTRYTSGMLENNRAQLKVSRDDKMMHMSTSVFVHSIKNQLLSSRVLYKKANAMIDQQETKEVRKILDQLSQQNTHMLRRIEELHQSVKAESVVLKPLLIQEVVKEAIRKYNEKYPEEELAIQLEENSLILGDMDHLSEAIYNVLINAQEAMDASMEDTEKQPVRLICRGTRQYSLVEIEDFGMGMREGEKKSVFQPFYSSKNSNSNWGMGLHYVQSIVKEHFGVLRLTSEYTKGTKVTFLLPKVKKDD